MKKEIWPTGRKTAPRTGVGIGRGGGERCGAERRREPTLRRLSTAIFLLLFLIAPNARSDDLSGWANDLTPDDHLSFQDGEFRYLGFGSPPRECRATYELTTEPPLSYISFEFPRHCREILHPFMRGAQEWMLLYTNPGIMFAYDREGGRPLGGGYWGGLGTWFIGDVVYRASSSLEEGGIVYSPDNLGRTETRRPWVEGVEGNGEGERITITYREWEETMEGLLFSIGFVSYERPDLYYRNSRPKKVRIESLEPQFSFTRELQDTPHPQFVPLPEPTAQLAVTIVDVYPGTQWEDSCINFVIPYARW